jgi:hypothetical protein
MDEQAVQTARVDRIPLRELADPGRPRTAAVPGWQRLARRGKAAPVCVAFNSSI